MRFHILGLAHTITTKEYSTCAFTQKTLKFCQMATGAGHEVIHYGHRDSYVPCSHVSIMHDGDLETAYPGWDWKTQGFPKFMPDDHAWQRFNKFATREIKARKQPGDFLLVQFPHRPIVDAFAGDPDLTPIAYGLGDGGPYFTFFKVFESYSLLHAYLGLGHVTSGDNPAWYDTVIPNYFDPDDFEYREKKDDYLLFLGRLNDGKGLHIAIQLAEATGQKLVVAGHGEYPDLARHSCVEYRGVADPELRRELLAGARAVICASQFCEPFCGVQVEAMLSGTPVISSDFGAFTEINLHGVTGYRCRTFGDFVQAVERIGEIRPQDCYEHGQFYSMDTVWPLYEKYFGDVQNVVSGEGWYTRYGL